jgi:hypothetical protein
VVDCAALEMPCTFTGTEGSNPSLSAFVAAWRWHKLAFFMICPTSGASNALLELRT